MVIEHTHYKFTELNWSSASNGGGSNLSLIISISTPTTIQLYVNASFATTANGYFQYVRLT